MKTIKELVNQNQKLTGDQIVDIITEVGKRGDIIIVKNDGIRNSANYTIVITSATNMFDSIRCDCDDLNTAIKNALQQYVQE